MNFTSEGLGPDSIKRNIHLRIGWTGPGTLLLRYSRYGQWIDKLREGVDIKRRSHRRHSVSLRHRME